MGLNTNQILLTTIVLVLTISVGTSDGQSWHDLDTEGILCTLYMYSTLADDVTVTILYNVQCHQLSHTVHAINVQVKRAPLRNMARFSLAYKTKQKNSKLAITVLIYFSFYLYAK
jgi:hypothetical protein